MYKSMLKTINRNNGFSLVEIMICVTVLGILTAVAVPVFSVSLKKRKIEECKMNRQMVTTTVQSVMAGIVDNGAKQNYITVLCKFAEGRHKVYETTDKLNNRGQTERDENGNVIKENVYDWNGNAMFKYENHIDNIVPKCVCDICGADMHKDTNSDGKCDVCGLEGVTNKKYLTSANHIDQAHLVYKDADGNDLANITESGVELEESGATAIDTYTAFIRLEYATVGDIRGGYRYAEVRDTYLKTYMDVQTKKAKALSEAQNDDERAIIIADYQAPDDLALNSILQKVQTSTDQAVNNPGYRCSDYDYKRGCNDGYYLKKCSMWTTPLYTLFANQEMPICPFDEKGNNGYFYYIDAAGYCHCTCPECNS